MKKKISLLEALTGFKFSVDHLDGRVLLVESGAEMVVSEGAFKKIQDEGNTIVTPF